MLVAICDDIPEQAQEISNRIKAVSEVATIDVYTDINQFFAVIKNDIDKYAAIFMDMEWAGSEKSGVDYVSELHEMQCRSKIICVTAYTMKYIEKLFWNDVKIFGVINKPIEDKSMAKILEKLIVSDEKLKEELVFECKDAVYRFRINEIVYVRSDSHKVIITTTNDAKSFYIAFREINKKLPDKFYCINKGITVNMDFVKRIEQSDVVLDYYGNVVTLPIGRNKKKDFKDKLFEYMRKINRI